MTSPHPPQLRNTASPILIYVTYTITPQLRYDDGTAHPEEGVTVEVTTTDVSVLALTGTIGVTDAAGRTRWVL